MMKTTAKQIIFIAIAAMMLLPLSGLYAEGSPNLWSGNDSPEYGQGQNEERDPYEPPPERNFTPPVNYLRIGLYFGGNALPSANLMNVRAFGYGNGFEFGYFDQYRRFVPSGQRTTENAITMRPGNTARSIEVVITNTNTRLFYFEPDDMTRNLGVMPIPETDRATQTWFRNHRYHGGFEYSRNGGDITVINVVCIEYYVKGVVPYEMSSSWPMEALKAQAVTARTFALRRLNWYRTHGFDMCTTIHCQVYRGAGGRATYRTDLAVRDTAGVFVTYNGRLIGTYYSAANGGASENSENVWVTAAPYLRGVFDPFEAYVAHRIPQYRWTITFTPAQITQRLRERGHPRGEIVHMEVSQYSPTGNAVSVRMRDANGRTLTFNRRYELINALGVRSQRFDIGLRRWEGAAGQVYVNDGYNRVDLSGAQILRSDGTARAVASGDMYALNAAGEVVRIATAAETAVNCNGMINGVFTITGTGHGHNVGMSQWGAYAMARFHGKTYVQIIEFYFTGVTVG